MIFERHERIPYERDAEFCSIIGTESPFRAASISYRKNYAVKTSWAIQRARSPQLDDNQYLSRRRLFSVEVKVIAWSPTGARRRRASFRRAIAPFSLGRMLTEPRTPTNPTDRKKQTIRREISLLFEVSPIRRFLFSFFRSALSLYNVRLERSLLPGEQPRTTKTNVRSQRRGSRDPIENSIVKRDRFGDRYRRRTAHPASINR